MSIPRVVVTGIGLISPLGNTVAAVANHVSQGLTAVGPVEAFDVSQYAVNLACMVPALPAAVADLSRDERLVEISEWWVACCADRALADAGLDLGGIDPARIGVCLASSSAGVDGDREFVSRTADTPLPPLREMARTPGTLTQGLASHVGALGPRYTVSTACAAGGDSIGTGMALIKAGRADVVLAGGVEPLSELSFSGFAILKSLTTTVLRPFDEARSGTMLGEAGVILVLESAERARRRGAHIWGEVCGYGLSNDANHATAPDPTGGGAALAVRRCLRDTGWSPDTIDYVNAHGTGTQYNDPMELSGLRTALGPSAERTPISSTKSLHGHTLSCAGSLEAVVVLAAMSQSCIPGNIGLTNPIADFASWRLPTGPEAGVLTRVLSTSFGFAGNNCCLALGAFRG